MWSSFVLFIKRATHAKKCQMRRAVISNEALNRNIRWLNSDSDQLFDHSFRKEKKNSICSMKIIRNKLWTYLSLHLFLTLNVSKSFDKAISFNDVHCVRKSLKNSHFRCLRVDYFGNLWWYIFAPQKFFRILGDSFYTVN